MYQAQCRLCRYSRESNKILALWSLHSYEEGDRKQIVTLKAEKSPPGMKTCSMPGSSGSFYRGNLIPSSTVHCHVGMQARVAQYADFYMLATNLY